MKPIWLLIFLHLFSSLVPYENTKFQGTQAQAHPWDCGPAAAATILKLAQKPAAPWPQELQGESISLAWLAAYLEQHSLETVGYKLNWEELAYFFSHFPNRPLLAHRRTKEGHFLVLVGLVENLLVSADPKQGVLLLPPTVFLEDFSGYILYFPQIPELPLVQEILKHCAQRLNLLRQAAQW